MSVTKSAPQNPLTMIILIIVLLICIFANLTNLFLNFQCLFINQQKPVLNNFKTYELLLTKYVHNGYVDYQKLKADRQWENTLNELKSPTLITTPEQYFAFWINAYNTLVLKTICDQYPLKSLHELKNAYASKKFIVNGQICSIQDIYNFKLLLPMQSQKNIKPLFLTCNGSVGWPKLLNHPIYPHTLYDDCESSIELFINNKANVIFKPQNKCLMISQFFQINKLIFDSLFGDPFNFVIEYYTYPHKEELYNITIEKYFFPQYNWLINDTSNQG